MKSVYVLMHQHKLDSMAYVRRFADIFHRAGMKVMAEEWLYQLAGEGGQPLLDGTSPKGCEAVISIGGDGTFLRANAVALEEGLPILGVNIGRVGFLTEIELDELEAAVAEQLELVHQGMYARAKKNLEEHIYEAHSVEEAKELQERNGGFVKTMWCGELDCELKMKELAGMSSRCIPFAQEKLGDTCACCGKPAEKMIYWGVAY